MRGVLVGGGVSLSLQVTTRFILQFTPLYYIIITIQLFNYMTRAGVNLVLRNFTHLSFEEILFFSYLNNITFIYLIYILYQLSNFLSILQKIVHELNCPNFRLNHIIDLHNLRKKILFQRWTTVLSMCCHCCYYYD